MQTITSGAGGLAGALGASVSSFQRAHSGVLTQENAQRYKELPQTMTALEQALDQAIRIDEQHSTSFWEELGELWDHGFGYLADKRRFDAEVAQLVERARTNMQTLRNKVDQAAEFLDVPDRLRQDVARWKSVADATHSTMTAIPGLGAVDGWQGRGAEAYGTMVGVQGEASGEYDSLPSNMEYILTLACEYNTQVLAATYGYVRTALNHSSMCYANGDKEFYVNTANVNSAVELCLDRIPAQYDAARQQANQMSGDIVELRNTPVVIRDGWPSGTSRAGQQGATAGPIAAPQTSPTPSGDKPGTVDGVHR